MNLKGSVEESGSYLWKKILEEYGQLTFQLSEDLLKESSRIVEWSVHSPSTSCLFVSAV